MRYHPHLTLFTEYKQKIPNLKVILAIIRHAPELIQGVGETIHVFGYYSSSTCCSMINLTELYEVILLAKEYYL
jgi:hypothetical protein